MTDSQTLLKKIAALRRKLEAVHGVAPQAVSVVESEEAARFRRLEQQISTGGHEMALLSNALRQLSPAAPVVDATVLPKKLTARARRVLEQGQELLARLRRLSGDFTSRPEEEHDHTKDSSA